MGAPHQILAMAVCVANLTACTARPLDDDVVSLSMTVGSGWTTQARAAVQGDIVRVRFGLARVEGPKLKLIAVQEVPLQGNRVAARFHHVPAGVYRGAVVALDQQGTVLNANGPALSPNVVTVQEQAAPVYSAGEILAVTVPLRDAVFATLPVRLPGMSQLGATLIEVQLVDVYASRVVAAQRLTPKGPMPAVAFHSVPNGMFQVNVLLLNTAGTVTNVLASSNLAIVTGQGDSVQWTASDSFVVPLPVVPG